MVFSVNIIQSVLLKEELRLLAYSIDLSQLNTPLFNFANLNDTSTYTIYFIKLTSVFIKIIKITLSHI